MLLKWRYIKVAIIIMTDWMKLDKSMLLLTDGSQFQLNAVEISIYESETFSA